MKTQVVVIVRGLYFTYQPGNDLVEFQNQCILKATEFLADVRCIVGIRSYVITDFENRIADENEVFCCYRLFCQPLLDADDKDFKRIQQSVEKVIERWFPSGQGVIPNDFDYFVPDGKNVLQISG